MSFLCFEYLLQLTRFGKLFLCVSIFGSHDFAKHGGVLSNKCRYYLGPLQRAHPKGHAYFSSGMLVLVSIAVFQGLDTLESSSPKLQVVGRFS